MKRIERIGQLSSRIRDVVSRLAASNDQSESHRNVLTHLIGNYVMVVNFVIHEMAHTPDGPAQREQFAARLNQMINRMQDATERLVQQSLGESLMQCHTVLARDVVEGAVRQISGYSAWKESRLEIDHPPQADVRVWVDYKAAQECLMTLLENAIKFSPHGSLVRLVYRKEGKFVSFLVMDSGPGIPPEEREHLFKSGFVGQVQATSGEPRFGAGLAVAKAFSEAMGGGIGHVVDHPAPGACFALRFLSR